MFTVLGSGFGIYGYLPALIETGRIVALPNRYRSAIASRPELSQYMQKVIWCGDEEDTLARSDGVVVALRPEDQLVWVPRLIRMSNIRQLILEKPIAPDPSLAASLLTMVDDAGKRYRVGYTFRFTPWADQLRAIVTEPVEEISLNWNFLAHHYKTGLASWKRFNSTGGGALRFYGIHVIALVAELGYDGVSTSIVWGPSPSEISRWEATFTGRDRCPFVLKINSQADDNFFRVIARKGKRELMLADARDPFSSDRSDVVTAQDFRVAVLKRLCRSLDDADDAYTQGQRNILALWASVERNSRRS